MNDAAEKYLSEGKLRTAFDSSMCGIQLVTGKLYVIAGRSQYIGICNYVRNYSRMTIVERRGFAGGYKKGCMCDVSKIANDAWDSL